MRTELLDQIGGAADAAKLWGLSPGTVKNMCANGQIAAKKVGPTWVIDKSQPNPTKSKNN